MKANNIFSWPRFALLLKRDLYMQYKSALIGLGAIFCILTIVNISSILSSGKWNFNLVFYPLTLFIGGFIFTSMSFNELAHERDRIPYLTLPASSLEKFVSKLIITNIGYVLVSIVLYLLFSGITVLFNTLVFRQSHPFFNPGDPVILFTIELYLVTHSVFLLGAVYFRANAFIKTILALFIIAVIYTGMVWLTGIVLNYALSFNKYGVTPPFFMFSGETDSPDVPQEIAIPGGILFFILQILFWVVMPPLFWVISYYRLKEIEV